jgi:glycosyltransferase involved in cell wall biosynthesis
MKPILFLNSHPIQYFAPLYKLISAKEKLPLLVLYCSDETLKGVTDKEFGVSVKWDTPLLEEYDYLFLKNHAINPSLFNGFFGLLNWGVLKTLMKQPSSIVIVHGWGFATHLITLIFAKFLGHKVCLRAETPINQEELQNKYFQQFKHLLLKLLFTRIDCFLYIGTQNKMFYQKLGISEDQLFFAPYCVDNSTFSSLASKSNKNDLKQKLAIPDNHKVILFSGKYIYKKRPLDLINAFSNLNNTNTHLIMLGEGEQRKNMEELIQEKKMQHLITLTGFINQSEIANFYAIADVFVMCSGAGETWGLSVNEAMNFGIPLVISNTTGCCKDLVIDGVNGFTFNTGDLQALTDCIDAAIQLTDEQKIKVMETHHSILEKYDYKSIVETIKIIAND